MSLRLLGTLLGVVLFVTGCSHTYSVLMKDGEQFDEQMAIRVTREALSLYGLDVSRMEPVPYGKTQSVFARNTLGAESGYVLWNVRNARVLYSYSVSIERREQEIMCDVNKTK
jgi:hypothetical protein